MRKFIIGLLFFFCIGSVGFDSLAAESNIIYVDLFEVFNEYEKTIEYDKDLEKEQSKREEEWGSLEEQISKLREQSKLLNEEKKKAKEEEIRKKRGALAEEKRKTLLDLRKERDQRMEEILKDINSAIEKYAKKNKVDLVLKKAAVAYGENKMEKTGEIIAILNKEYKK